MCFDIMVRGGIADGTFFADDTMIWGQALVDAYKIEETVAVYPRVVVQDSLYQKYNDNDALPVKQILYQSEDSLFSIDFLSAILISNIDETVYHDFVVFLQRRIEIALEKSDMKVLAKDYWLNSYVVKKWSQYEEK